MLSVKSAVKQFLVVAIYRSPPPIVIQRDHNSMTTDSRGKRHGYAHRHARQGSCAALCWGLNENAGQLGDGTWISHRGVPAAVAGGGTYDGIAAGAVATCAHTPGNELYCWGSNYIRRSGQRAGAGGRREPSGPEHRRIVLRR